MGTCSSKGLKLIIRYLQLIDWGHNATTMSINVFMLKVKSDLWNRFKLKVAMLHVFGAPCIIYYSFCKIVNVLFSLFATIGFPTFLLVSSLSKDRCFGRQRKEARKKYFDILLLPAILYSRLLPFLYFLQILFWYIITSWICFPNYSHFIKKITNTILICYFQKEKTYYLSARLTWKLWSFYIY